MSNNPWNDPPKQSSENPWSQPDGDAPETNPWGQPQEAAPATAGWSSEPADNTQDFVPVSAPPKKTNRVGGFLIGLIIVLALAIIGAVAWLFFSGRLGEGTPASSGDPESVVVTASDSANAGADSEVRASDITDAGQPASPSREASATSSAAATRDEDADSSEDSTQASARSIERRTTSQSEPAAIPEAAQAAGLTATGWSDNTSTRCAATENLVYAGRDTDAWITVCESNGQLTYRSDIFGGTLAQPVNLGRSNPQLGEFHIDAAPSTIKVVGGGVEVFQNNALIAEKNLPSAWILD